jgi:hypothetical protein
MDFDDWDSMETLLYKLSDESARKGSRGSDKPSSPLISPATYSEGSKRNNDSVISWSWAALDIDDHEISGDLESELFSKFGHYYYVCYSTASSRPDYPKFRLVFPLTHEVSAKNIRHFWFALNSEFKGLGDPQTKDLSRMYYIPGQYPDAYNFIFTNKGGQFINPTTLMKDVIFVEQTRSANFIDMLPKEMQEQVINHRRDKLKNKKFYNWSGVSDCPFINKQMLRDYSAISDTGWYHKMYQMMVSISFAAIRREYPITAEEIEILMRELDSRTGNWYKKRPILKEANSALNYAYKTHKI